jgi:uncharacterized membrane protein YhhN
VTGTAFLLLALALTVAFVDWIAVARHNRPLEYVCKPLVMVLLIATTLALDPSDALGGSGDAVRTWFIVALVLCLLGDILLMLPRDLFVFGLAAFLLGHIGYIAGMHVDGVEAGRFLVGIVVVMVAVGILGTIILRSVRAGPDPKLAGPVVAYMFVISAMVASAIGAGRGLAIAGATSFYASDALIAWDRFKAKVPHGRVLIMVTYHLAQVALVLSLV